MREEDEDEDVQSWRDNIAEFKTRNEVQDWEGTMLKTFQTLWKVKRGDVQNSYEGELSNMVKKLVQTYNKMPSSIGYEEKVKSYKYIMHELAPVCGNKIYPFWNFITWIHH